MDYEITNLEFGVEHAFLPITINPPNFTPMLPRHEMRTLTAAHSAPADHY